MAMEAIDRRRVFELPRHRGRDGNAGDNVFADGTQTEMATVAGDPGSGYTADLTVTISV